jgi:flagellar biosynthesis protein FlhF
VKTTKDKRFKFIVSSAEEAVKVLRERLGADAHVISVRQVEGAGLARFLSAPKLEIIAEVGVTSPPEEKPHEEPLPVAAPEPEEVEDALASGDPVTRLLLRGGITGPMLARLKSRDDWATITRGPLRQVLTEVAVLLRAEYQRNQKNKLGQVVAFIGTAGSGKTTALCKRLALEVFFKQRRGVVLKLDLDKANPCDGLAVFCDVLGVPLIRSASAIPELAPDETLFIDFPGISAESRGDIAEMTNLLDTLPPCSRVLTVHAAYETSLMRQAYRMGSALAASHVVFTHLDELRHWGKLWEFILTPALTPLFLSSGQNIAGDFNEAVFDAVLDHSFRLVGKENAMQRTAL